MTFQLGCWVLTLCSRGRCNGKTLIVSKLALWIALQVLSTRFLKNLYRHPMLLLLNFAAAVFMAAVVGAVYWDAGEPLRVTAQLLVHTQSCVVG